MEKKRNKADLGRIFAFYTEFKKRRGLSEGRSKMLAIIGGTGVYDLSIFDEWSEQTVATPYGDTVVVLGKMDNKTVVFMTRHGKDHKIPPHKINYQANIFALKSLGVESIIATTAVGSLRRDILPGTFVFCDQFLDFTKVRNHTFFDGPPHPVVHTDMSKPYCPELQKLLIKIAKDQELNYHSMGTYVCTEGPRFESAAEVAYYNQIGGTVVGMTGVPEVTLAREAEMCYTTVSMVTNLGTGLSENPLTHEEVLEIMAANQNNFKNLISEAIREWNPAPKGQCACPDALSEYGGFLKYFGK